MICEECKQRPATVHLTKIYDNKKIELHLCEECARAHTGLPIKFNFSLEPGLSMQKLLASLLGGAAPKEYSAGADVSEDVTAEGGPQCPNCSLTYRQFGQTGRLGCSRCYQAFAAQLEPLLRRVQGNIRHTGKVPQRSAGLLGFRRELESLKGELRSAIQAEAYERAAVLRDRIRALEAQCDAGSER
jgi:protein arginine kinase activator